MDLKLLEDSKEEVTQWPSHQLVPLPTRRPREWETEPEAGEPLLRDTEQGGFLLEEGTGGTSSFSHLLGLLPLAGAQSSSTRASRSNLLS